MGMVESRGYDNLQQAYSSLKKLQANVCPPAKHQAVLLRLDPSLHVWAEPRSASSLFILQTSLAQLSPCIVQPGGSLQHPTTHHAVHGAGTPTQRSAPATPFSAGHPVGPPPSVLIAARATLEMQRNMQVVPE